MGYCVHDRDRHDFLLPDWLHVAASQRTPIQAASRGRFTAGALEGLKRHKHKEITAAGGMHEATLSAHPFTFAPAHRPRERSSIARLEPQRHVKSKQRGSRSKLSPPLLPPQTHARTHTHTMTSSLAPTMFSRAFAAPTTGRCSNAPSR